MYFGFQDFVTVISGNGSKLTISGTESTDKLDNGPGSMWPMAGQGWGQLQTSPAGGSLGRG